jgi:hypothetical protein
VLHHGDKILAHPVMSGRTGVVYLKKNRIDFAVAMLTTPIPVYVVLSVTMQESIAAEEAVMGAWIAIVTAMMVVLEDVS